MGVRMHHPVAVQPLFGGRPRYAFFMRFRYGCLRAALRFWLEVRDVESVQTAQLDGYVFID